MLGANSVWARTAARGTAGRRAPRASTPRPSPEPARPSPRPAPTRGPESATDTTNTHTTRRPTLTSTTRRPTTGARSPSTTRPPRPRPRLRRARPPRRRECSRAATASAAIPPAGTRTQGDVAPGAASGAGSTPPAIAPPRDPTLAHPRGPRSGRLPLIPLPRKSSIRRRAEVDGANDHWVPRRRKELAGDRRSSPHALRAIGLPAEVEIWSIIPAKILRVKIDWELWRLRPGRGESLRPLLQRLGRNAPRWLPPELTRRIETGPWPLLRATSISLTHRLEKLETVR